MICTLLNRFTGRPTLEPDEWQRTSKRGQWPVLYWNPARRAVKIHAVHKSPDALRWRYWQAVVLGAVPAAAWGWSVYLSVPPPKDPLFGTLLFMGIVTFIGGYGGAKLLFLALLWIQARTVVVMRPGGIDIKSSGRWTRRNLPLHPQTQFALREDMRRVREAVRLRAHEEKIRAKTPVGQVPRDEGAYPKEMRIIYSGSDEVYMSAPGQTAPIIVASFLYQPEYAEILTRTLQEVNAGLQYPPPSGGASAMAPQGSYRL